MAKYQSSPLPAFRLTFLLACCMGLSLANAGERDGTEWKVTRGDTLYQIGRSIYPDDAGQQTRLRQDIMMLNPEVFASDALSMQPGTVLKLPRYVVDPQAAKAAPTPRPAPAPAPPKPAPVKSAPVTGTADEAPRANWVVKRGDTLYSIGRSIYPQNSRKQAFLRQDIVKLNRSAFANGIDNLAVGTVLTIPGYVNQEAQRNSANTAQVPTLKSAPATVTTAPAATATIAKPAPSTASETPQPAAKAVTSPEPVNRRKALPDPDIAGNNFLISVGLAYGGDDLVEVDSGFDITGGSGINLRLGYQHLPGSGHGYRAALGLQYHAVKDATLTDTYLQLAYQYRTNPYVYGIGVVTHAGAEVRDIAFDLDFDPSTGLFVYVENTGADILGGWGLSLTALEMEEQDSGDKVDASSIEVYYSWNL